jgi:hypothetical protein
MIPDPKPIPYSYDNASNFTRGVDTSKAPDLIAEGYVSFALNTIFRGGKPSTRPAFHELELPDQPYIDAIRYKKHQGDTIYRDYESNEIEKAYLITVRAGIVYRMDFNTLIFEPLETASLIPHNEDVTVGINNTTRRHYFQQVDKYLIIQNGIDVPLIYDGVEVRRARNIDNNPPLGTSNDGIVNSGGIATVTTLTAHGLNDGDFVVISGNVIPSGYIETYRVLSTPTATTYTIEVSSTLGNASAVASGATYFPMEVPTGLFMEFCLGRLCVVLPDRRSMKIGDLIRSTPDTGGVESVLWFTEELFLAESYVLTLPAEQGRIRAIAAIPFMGASTGQGDLMISGDNGISTLSLGIAERSLWKTTPGIQKVALVGTGVSAKTGVTGYNGDLLFRDTEYGIRSFRIAEARFTKNPSQSPISAELNRIFAADDQDKLEFTYLEVFDNRLLSTITPVFAERKIRVNSISVLSDTATITLNEAVSNETTNSVFIVGDKIKINGTSLTQNGLDGEFEIINVISPTQIEVAITIGTDQSTPGGFIYSQKTGAEFYHRGLAVLDYTTLSGAGGETSASWDGIWTGLNTQSILKAQINNKNRCFVTHYNNELNRNEIWEITKEQGPDLPEGYEVSDLKYPECWIELATMDCDTPFAQKKLLGLDVYLSNIKGSFNASVYYRNDGDPCWREWSEASTSGGTFEVCASTNLNDVGETNPNSQNLIQPLSQHRVVKIGQPGLRSVDYECEIITAADTRLFYETQIKISWTGIATWDKIKLMALEQIEDMRGGCFL